MVEANLSGLKSYLCDKPNGIRVGKDQQAINVYPFLGDAKADLAKNDVMGFDVNNDGRLDGYIATSSVKLNNFVSNATTDPRKYEALEVWGTPVVISRERLQALTDHCQEVTRSDETMRAGSVVKGLGVIFIVVGLGIKSSSLVWVGGVLLVVGTIFVYANDDYNTAFSNMHKSLQHYLP